MKYFKNEDNIIKGFQFKHFFIANQTCGMPVSTDGILLGAWAQANQDSTILDIGTGTGLLALMMAQRFKQANIIAIDIDENAVKTAQFNTAQSAWANRIKIHCCDIILWQNAHKVDTIICNPPYFTSGPVAKNATRAATRHTHCLSHETLLQVIKNNLSHQGQAHLILPTEPAEQFIQKALSLALFCHKMTDIKTTPNKPVSRKLLTLSAQKTKECLKNQLIIQDNGHYSSEFISLTKDFYLKM